MSYFIEISGKFHKFKLIVFNNFKIDSITKDNLKKATYSAKLPVLPPLFDLLFSPVDLFSLLLALADCVVSFVADAVASVSAFTLVSVLPPSSTFVAVSKLAGLKYCQTNDIL